MDRLRTPRQEVTSSPGNKSSQFKTFFVFCFFFFFSFETGFLCSPGYSVLYIQGWPNSEIRLSLSPEHWD